LSDPEKELLAMNLEVLLDQPHLSLISAPADAELARIGETVAHVAPIASRAELEELFGRLLAARRAIEPPKTLDLVGHSAPGSCLLTLGTWRIDASNPVVSSYFRELAENDVLPRLGVHAVRLIGSLTADTPVGQYTICALSEILGLEVYGTKNVIYSTHFRASGFADERSYFLARASDLRREPPSSQPLIVGDPTPRALDVDALPAYDIGAFSPTSWPRRFATREQAAEILGLVRRGDGRAMPGLLAEPVCELALPGPERGTFHLAQVVLDGAWIRVYHDGPDQPAVCYSVASPREMLALVDQLPSSAIA
jgi:hypothetical protein